MHYNIVTNKDLDPTDKNVDMGSVVELVIKLII